MKKFGAQHLLDCFRSLRGRPTQQAEQLEKDLLKAQRDAAELDLRVREMECRLVEQSSTLAQCRKDLEAAESMWSLEALSRLAGAMSQIRVQEYLFSQGREISAKSALTLAARIVEDLEDQGMLPIETVGATVKFDPERFASLEASKTIEPGAEVIVRFIGYKHRGRILMKALVEEGP